MTPVAQWDVSFAKEGLDDWLMDGQWPTIKSAYVSKTVISLHYNHNTLYTICIFWLGINNCIYYLVRTASNDLSKANANPSSRSFLICLSSVLWCCLASFKNNSAMLEWCYSARAFSRALGFWPHSITCIGTHSICTPMKSFHAIKKEIKSESLPATFFSSPDCITKEHRNNGGIGLLQALNWDVLLKCRALLWGHADCGSISSKWAT